MKNFQEDSGEKRAGFLLWGVVVVGGGGGGGIAASAKVTELWASTLWSILSRRRARYVLPLIQKIGCFGTKCSYRLLLVASFKKCDARGICKIPHNLLIDDSKRLWVVGSIESEVERCVSSARPDGDPLIASVTRGLATRWLPHGLGPTSLPYMTSQTLVTSGSFS